VQLQLSALYRVVLQVTVTQAGLRRTDKDDDGAIITAAFIACIHSGIAAVKAYIRSRSDVHVGYAHLIRDVLTTSMWPLRTATFIVLVNLMIPLFPEFLRRIIVCLQVNPISTR